MNKTKEVVVVGAGLAGLTAAYNLARDGNQVTVLERYKQVGGVPEAHPAVDVTPMDEIALGRFIGVELGPPQVNTCEQWNTYVYGHKVQIDLTHINLKCVERGSHKTSIDYYLYEKCLEAGVRFEFGRHLVTQSDFANLPPGSVIATGLLHEAFEALHIPYQKVFGYLGRGKTKKGNCCAVWFHDYTLDYAYYGAANGYLFCLFFAREPVRESEWELFKEKQLKGQEGMECSSWIYHEGLVPTASFRNPRLFAADKILAGTISGMMDPFALFGVHGSLVSGKIAAIAHKDKARAYELFKKYTRFFPRNLILKRILDSIPVTWRKAILPAQLKFMSGHTSIFKRAMTRFNKAIPGYTELPF